MHAGHDNTLQVRGRVEGVRVRQSGTSARLQAVRLGTQLTVARHEGQVGRHLVRGRHVQSVRARHRARDVFRLGWIETVQRAEGALELVRGAHDTLTRFVAQRARDEHVDRTGEGLGFCVFDALVEGEARRRCQGAVDGTNALEAVVASLGELARAVATQENPVARTQLADHRRDSRRGQFHHAIGQSDFRGGQSHRRRGLGRGLGEHEARQQALLLGQNEVQAKADGRFTVGDDTLLALTRRVDRVPSRGNDLNAEILVAVGLQGIPDNVGGGLRELLQALFLGDPHANDVGVNLVYFAGSHSLPHYVVIKFRNRIVLEPTISGTNPSCSNIAEPDTTGPCLALVDTYNLLRYFARSCVSLVREARKALYNDRTRTIITTNTIEVSQRFLAAQVVLYVDAAPLAEATWGGQQTVPYNLHLNSLRAQRVREHQGDGVFSFLLIFDWHLGPQEKAGQNGVAIGAHELRVPDVHDSGRAFNRQSHTCSEPSLVRNRRLRQIGPHHAERNEDDLVEDERRRYFDVGEVAQNEDRRTELERSGGGKLTTWAIRVRASRNVNLNRRRHSVLFDQPECRTLGPREPVEPDGHITSSVPADCPNRHHLRPGIHCRSVVGTGGRQL
ncbi:hypothetical protein [Achromobacter phage maay_LB1]|nr:hypothetical protein [Achromobacter phage maay_LB1]